MGKMRSSVITLILVSLLLLIFSGCQAVFTASPFAEIMKPDPADIPAERLAEYCADVLLNGTDAEKAAAYAALKATLADGENATDPDLNYMAGAMALDQAGLTAAVDSFLSGGDATDFDTFLTSVATNTELLAAGDYLSVAYSGGASLTSSDKVIGGLASLVEAVGSTAALTDGTVDYANPDPAHATAVLMIEEGSSALSNIYNNGVVLSAEGLLNIIFP